MTANKPTPIHLVRRAELLQQACMDCVRMLSGGMPLIEATVAVVRKFNGRKLPNGHKLHLSRTSFHRHWYKWISSGCYEVFIRKPEVRQQDPRVDFCVFLVKYIATVQKVSVSEAYRIVDAQLNIPAAERTIQRRVSNERLQVPSPDHEITKRSEQENLFVEYAVKSLLKILDDQPEVKEAVFAPRTPRKRSKKQDVVKAACSESSTNTAKCKSFPRKSKR